MDYLKGLKLWAVGRYLAFSLYAISAILLFKTLGVYASPGFLGDLGTVFLGFTFIALGLGVLLHMAAECLRIISGGEVPKK